MTKEELKAYLKEALTLEVKPKGWFGASICLKLENEVISEESLPVPNSAFDEYR